MGPTFLSLLVVWLNRLKAFQILDILCGGGPSTTVITDQSSSYITTAFLNTIFISWIASENVALINAAKENWGANINKWWTTMDWKQDERWERLCYDNHSH